MASPPKRRWREIFGQPATRRARHDDRRPTVYIGGVCCDRALYRRVCRAVWLTAALCCPAPTAAADETLLAAQALLLRGRYAEAAERFVALAEKFPVEAVLGQAQAEAATGRDREALARLTAAAAERPAAAVVHAQRAALLFQAGDESAAAAAVDAALALDENQLQARWLRAELHRTAGRLDEAEVGYQWLVDRYNASPPRDPDGLRWIGLAAGQFARWKRLSDQFRFLVNELYPDALAADANFWPAHYESGRLFLEKYNRAEAAREFEAALKINPSAAEVHAAVAQLHLNDFEFDAARKALQRALAVNPRLLAAQQLLADVQLANFEVQPAIDTLLAAVPLNPHSEETLGRLAAAYLLRDGAAAVGPETEFGKLAGEVLARNPRAGEFYFHLATALEVQRRFGGAEQYFLEAIQRMPQRIGPEAGLGMLYMRLGREDDARRVLEAALAGDPFHVRVKNMLEVLDVLAGYATLESEHFLVRYDAEHDAVFARSAVRHLERIYPELCDALGYRPKDKSLFEIFFKAKNTSGHGWFSARTVGLPYVGTVGACTGKMVALASPNDGKQPYNWARVLKHEFVHVINLEQTNYNIPHWFTEAIAVWNEGYPRPDEWNKLLARRIPARQLFDLETINLGFVRPQSGLEWQMAYCQAELYVEYMLAKFGPDAVTKMLAAYADNKNTRQALNDALGTSQEAFEQGYLEHLDTVAEGLADPTGDDDAESVSELERRQRASPENVDLAAKMALAHLERKNYPAARKLVDDVRRKIPKHGLASYVRARLHLVVGENQEALAALTAGLDRQAPEPRLLNFLAALKFKAGAHAEAIELYQLGAVRWPHDLTWQKRLAKVFLETGDAPRLTAALEKLAESDADDFTIRKKLAQLALEREDANAAARWAEQALEINVLDSSLQRLYAQALQTLNRHADAAWQWETLVELEPDDTDVQVALAEAYRASGRTADAQAACRKILADQPDHPRAQTLLKELGP